MTLNNAQQGIRQDEISQTINDRTYLLHADENPISPHGDDFNDHLPDHSPEQDDDLTDHSPEPVSIPGEPTGGDK